MPVAVPLTVLAPAEWSARRAAHERRVDVWVEPHLERARRREPHPVLDFLFTYYSHRPAQLRRWHPGLGVALAGEPEHRTWRGYTETPVGVTADASAIADRRDTVGFVADLLRRTADRPPFLGCFGLHEWAMVYRSSPEEVRHAAVPLRLGAAGVARVVEAAPLRCTHFDAFRFFTPQARPRNVVTPTRDAMPDLEQPGCLHTTMDLYKYAYKLTPYVASELVADCFALARDVRELDMRAGPYDLTSFGYPPVPIETPAGRAEYASAQRAFAERGRPLRLRLIEVCEALLAAVTPAAAR
jgi:hypothetical protein